MDAKTKTFLEKYNYNNLFGIKYEASSFIPIPDFITREIRIMMVRFTLQCRNHREPGDQVNFLCEYLSVLTFGEAILANLEGIKSQIFPNHPTMAWPP